MSKLTQERNFEAPFEICFKYPLERDYTFNELTSSELKQFQKFLNKVSKMTATQVDKSYSRKPDKTDIYRGMQVYHYEISQKFRVHVVVESEYYKVIRLDPKHKFHG